MTLSGRKIPGGARDVTTGQPWVHPRLNLPVALLSAVLLFTGCATAPTQPERATNEIGQVFELVQPAITNAAYTDIELWERINPSDTNRWYTPSLDWTLHPTNPPSFKSVMR